MPRKGWKNVGVKEALMAEVEKHLRRVDSAKVYPRSIPRFVAEAIQNQLQKENIS